MRLGRGKAVGGVPVGPGATRGSGGVTRATAVLGGAFLVVMTAIVTWGLATGAYGWSPGSLGTLRALGRQPGFANLVRALTLIRSQYVGQPNMSKVYAGAISGAVRALNDPYSTYFSPRAYAELTSNASGRYSGIGVQVEAGAGGEPVVLQVFPGSPAATTRYVGEAQAGAPGLRPGDRLLSVGGMAVRGLSLPQVAARILGPAGTPVVLRVARTLGDGRVEDLTFSFVRRPVTIVTVAARMLPGRVGYLDISGFNAQTPAEVAVALSRLTAAGMTGLVLDLRNNPGGVLDAAIETGAFFLPPGTVTSLQGRTGRQTYVLRSTRRIAVPFVVLVNRYTASAAEVLAGAIEDDHAAPLVGQRTFGKGVVQRVFPLSGGAGLRLTVAQYYTPKGRDLNGRGLEPDLVVPSPPSVGDYGQPARDPQLAAALALLARVAKRAA